MTARAFDFIWLFLAIAVAVFLGGKIDDDPVSLAVIVLSASLVPVFLFAGMSFLGIVIMGCGAYSGTIGLLNSFPSGFPGLQLHDVITVTLTGVSLLMLLSHIRRLRRGWILMDLFYLLFLGWAAFRAYQSPVMFDALKDCTFFLVFWTMMVLTRFFVREDPRRATMIGDYLMVGTTVSLSLILLFVVLGSASWTSIGLATPLGKRPLALFLLVSFSAALAQWLYPLSARQRRRGFVFACISGGLILLTLSRTVVVTIAIVHVPLVFVARNRRSIKSPANVVRIACYVVMVLFLGYMSLKLDVVQERFFFRGGQMTHAEMLHWRNLNTMGRNYVWPIVWRRCLRKPVMGHGTGSARSFSARIYGWEHPHNDYLRVFHDQGIIGVVFFCMFWVTKVRRMQHNRARSQDSTMVVQANSAALTATFGIVLSFLTDNTVVYTYAMLPLGMLIGAAEALEESVAKSVDEKAKDVGDETA
jgi:O-antigen ligase